MMEKRRFDFTLYNNKTTEWMRRGYLLGIYILSIFVFRSWIFAIVGAILIGGGLYFTCVYEDIFEVDGTDFVQITRIGQREKEHVYNKDMYTIFVNDTVRKFRIKQQYMVTIQNKQTSKLHLIPIDLQYKDIKDTDFDEQFDAFKALAENV